jgi:integrase
MAGKRREWGRVRQLASGRWQARYPSPDGRLLPAPDTFDTRKQAAAWLAHKQAEIARDDWIDPDAGKVTFGEYSARWIAERTLSDTTRERYEGILRNHLEPFLGSRPMADIKPPVVRRWRHERLEQGGGRPTVAKAYRLLHAIFATATDDQIVRRNPCRIKGASDDTAPERSVLTVKEVFRVADAIAGRYRALVLLAAFTSLRFGELAALVRRDIDLVAGEVRVRHSQAELRGRLHVKAPKSEAGKRVVAIPPAIVRELMRHMDEFAQDGAEGLVFVGPLGGRLRRHNFRKLWLRALDDAGLGDRGVHFHDLRHTGNHLAAITGASTKELMARMGHSSVRAAMIYQHATRERDREIARAMRVHVDPDGPQRADQASEGHAGGTNGPSAPGEPAA